MQVCVAVDFGLADQKTAAIVAYAEVMIASSLSWKMAVSTCVDEDVSNKPVHQRDGCIIYRMVINPSLEEGMRRRWKVGINPVIITLTTLPKRNRRVFNGIQRERGVTPVR